MPQDHRLQPDSLRCGLDPEFGAQPQLQTPVHRERIGLPVAAVRRHHGQLVRTFSQRLVGDQLCGQQPGLRGAAGIGHVQQSGRPFLNGDSPQFGEPGSIGRHQFRADVGERVGSPPERQCVPVGPAARLTVALFEGPAGVGQKLVESVLVGQGAPIDEIADLVGDDRVVAEPAPEPGHHRVHDGNADITCSVSPDKIEQGVGGDRTATTLDQHCQDIPQPLTARRGVGTVQPNLQRAEHGRHASGHAPGHATTGGKPGARDRRVPPDLAGCRIRRTEAASARPACARHAARPRHESCVIVGAVAAAAGSVAPAI